MLIKRLFCFCAVASVASFADAAVVSHYTFDDAANVGADSAGANHGTLQGDAAQTAGFIGSGALALDGDGDFVALTGSNASLEALDDDGDGWTVTSWVKTAGNGDVARIVSTDMPDGWAGGGWGVGVRQDRGSDEFISTTYGVVDMQAGTASLDGEWHHLGFVMRNDGDAIATDYYLDGVLEGSAAPGNGFGITATSNDYAIGRLGLPAALQYFNGSLDDLRIYDHELSAGDVRALVPEPNSGVLLLIGGLMALVRRRR
ncbi:LamG-like jellyroll fold domain-containing protein [Planctomycetota bacterium]